MLTNSPIQATSKLSQSLRKHPVSSRECNAHTEPPSVSMRADAKTSANRITSDFVSKDFASARMLTHGGSRETMRFRQQTGTTY
jgi:hypothetical protein